jgi:preprotein translocase SecE subunit
MKEKIEKLTKSLSRIRKSSPKKKKGKKSKDGFLKKTLEELKKADWLSFKEWLQYLIFVILFSALIVLIILALDVIFFRLRDRYILSNESIIKNLGELFENIYQKINDLISQVI